MPDADSDGTEYGADTPQTGDIRVRPVSGAQRVAASLDESNLRHRAARSRLFWIVGGLATVGLVLVVGGWLLSRMVAVPAGPPSEGAARQRPSGAGDSTDTMTPRALSDSATSSDATSLLPSARAGSSASSTTLAAAPESPSAPGTPLSTLAASPPGTIAMVVVPKGFERATYKVVFRPYGWGPGGSKAGRLAVLIESSRPSDQGAEILARDFAKHNLNVWCTAECARQIGSAGEYSGVVEVLPQGDVGVLYLTQATRR